MPDHPAQPAPADTAKVETQTSRRVKYTINLLVAIDLAVGIAIMINVMVYWYKADLPRFDWTATRQYTLSDQARKVVERVDEDIRIVTLFHKPDVPRSAPEAERELTRLKKERIQDAIDLADEYARLSPRVTAEHIDPVWQPERYDAFLLDIRGRFQASLNPMRQAIDKAKVATDQARADLEMRIAPLKELVQEPTFTDLLGRRQANMLHQRFVNARDEMQKNQLVIDRQLGMTLPDYTQSLKVLKTQLLLLNKQFYPTVINEAQAIVNMRSTPNAVKEQLLAFKRSLEPVQRHLEHALADLKDIEQDAGYDETRALVMGNDPAVVISKNEIRAVPLREMFERAVAADPATPQAEAAFLGEEKLTGALVQMQLKTPPLVVFVVAGQVKSDPKYTMSYVAERLRKMNFQVAAYNPAPRFDANRQPLPPQDLPQPAPGQSVVWVFPAAQIEDERAADISRPFIAKFLAQRLAEHQPVLLNVGPNPSAKYGADDPVLKTVADFGITPLVDRAVMQELLAGETDTVASPFFIVEDWADEPAIANAVKGMPAAFQRSCPLLISKPAHADAVVTPLITLREQRMWAERDFDGDNIKLNPAEAKDEFVIAAIAKRADSRLIVVGNAYWASDLITSNADPSLRRGLNLAKQYGAAYPGNTELFVNSVYWLAGLDELIAPGARSQDIRRVDHIESAALTRLKWTMSAGVPLGVLIIGLAVYFVRRRD